MLHNHKRKSKAENQQSPQHTLRKGKGRPVSLPFLRNMVSNYLVSFFSDEGRDVEIVSAGMTHHRTGQIIGRSLSVAGSAGGQHGGGSG
jgi:hypothetical protein